MNPIKQFIQRPAGQQTLRRLAGSEIRRFAAPATLSSIQIRPVATQKLTPADSHEILVAQRKLRPNSPHIAIYQPQIPWILSITHRITGSVLSGGFYIFGSAYLVAPLLGWHLDSVSLAAAFGAWPLLAKAGVKFALAWPFTFHCLNGLRHLMWDFALGFKNKFVIQSGWTVVGASLLSALGLAAFV